MWWRDRQPYLASRGYMLRPRYRAGWKPSWIGTNVDPEFCEDAIDQMLPQILDATRPDGTVVALKHTKRTTQEIAIARFLCSERFKGDPRNHCAPVLDVFPDPVDPTMVFFAMPLLRPFDDPEFGAFGEVLDFIGQTLEGIAFMHSLNVAHRDCAGPNIMMDARPLYPEGWHPVRRDLSPDAIHQVKPLQRVDAPVRYYFVDFGLSTRLDSERKLVVGGKGRDQDVPELSWTTPYDPFKVDIFTLGHLYQAAFYEKFHGMECLLPLIQAMMAQDPGQRPTAEASINIFTTLRANINPSALRMKLRRQDETISERIIKWFAG
ncbi:hypothetical protein GLOTRDRAFT_109463 [Gloeophyllum trabeum ATCC 11539]|uniref:Protein kinase domain-containing protein n=1 Tax=Gloeophyllum trabeum (strain ATCC 11539 / FP-39264 / Madison 617) TaxID=670483 RepID=S7QIA1_GLOTA|nr:uncharacterized protein GLOTRDRAFT_109463 [Gloeophyllum trabeum ATCC 11539]EPQ58922.1 hypothetical protein GLOTRDRAFT_109463 [Gloeophyllum trabeum ATCC 11539]